MENVFLYSGPIRYLRTYLAVAKAYAMQNRYSSGKTGEPTLADMVPMRIKEGRERKMTIEERV